MNTNQPTTTTTDETLRDQVADAIAREFQRQGGWPVVGVDAAGKPYKYRQAADAVLAVLPPGDGRLRDALDAGPFSDDVTAVADALVGRVASAVNGFGADLVRVERCYAMGLAQAAVRALLDQPTGEPPRRTVADLIEASSLGTPEAKALRESVPPDDAARVVARARALPEPLAECASCARWATLAGRQAGTLDAVAYLLDGDPDSIDPGDLRDVLMQDALLTTGEPRTGGEQRG